MIESDLEARLHILEQELRFKQSGGGKGNKRIILITALILVAVATLVAFLFIYNQGANPIPKNIRSSLGFPFYYPSPTPQGYQYKKDSAKVESNIIFYSLQNNNQTVTITEQATFGKPPDLTQIAGFKTLDTPIGKAVSGTNAGNRPAAIIISNTTIITISGNTTTPATAVNDLAKSMHSQ